MYIKFAYTIFIGILLATFVGVGIAAFYHGPKSPEYPVTLSYPKTDPTTTESAQLQRDQEKFNKVQKEFQDQSEQYNRNVSIFALIAAVILLAASLTALRNVYLIADGFLLGGILTLIYSIIRGFGAQDSMFRFVVVTVGLIMALFLGYIKITKPSVTTQLKN